MAVFFFLFSNSLIDFFELQQGRIIVNSDNYISSLANKIPTQKLTESLVHFNQTIDITCSCLGKETTVTNFNEILRN